MQLKLFDKAKGDYLAFLDDDDIWLPDKLSIQIEMYKKEYKMSCTEKFIGEGIYEQNKNKQYIPTLFKKSKKI